MRDEHVLPVFGVVEDPTFNGFCMVSPWMQNGNLRHYLETIVNANSLSGDALLARINQWVCQIMLIDVSF